MTNIATLTKRAHDTGFGQGSLTAVNAILGYLDHIGQRAIAQQVLAAWDNGTIAKMAGLAVAAPAAEAPGHADLMVAPETIDDIIAAIPPPTKTVSPSKIGRDQARASGYTGDECTACFSMQVKRNGSCLVCEACGQTTGCS